MLAPAGRFILVLGHPLLQAPGSAWIDDHEHAAHHWRIGGYLDDDTVVDSVAPGIDFVFIHRPLSRYVHAMGKAGLLIEDMEEPPPPARLLAEAWPFPEAATIPRLLLLRARRAGVAGSDEVADAAGAYLSTARANSRRASSSNPAEARWTTTSSRSGR